MLSYSENILQVITGKTSLQDVTIEQLQKIVDTYPYFGAAQFFLAKKMFDNKIEGFENALQKTALHFNNTLLLHFNLNEETEFKTGEPLISTKNTNYSVEAEESTLANITKDDVEKAVAEKNEILTSEETISYITEDIESKVIEFKEAHPEIIHIENDKQDDEVFEDEVEDSTNEIAKEDGFEPNERLSNLLKEQAEALEKPIETTVLSIENIPAHRVDYFESQGIKLDPEKEANDKLGIQLKRFTDWLKQMKRVSPNLNNLETDAAGEIQAQNMAARSNDPKEVVTKTMAEVLIKQGKPEEAITIYEKLSFSNPSKSAYFAAKIKNLKLK